MVVLINGNVLISVLLYLNELKEVFLLRVLMDLYY